MRAQRASETAATNYPASNIAIFNINEAKKKTQITRTILVITFLYIFATFPSILQTGYLYPNIIALESGTLIVSAINAIDFSYPALNFFILFFSNKMFADEVKAFFKNFKRNHRVNDLRPIEVMKKRQRLQYLNNQTVLNNILDRDFQ